MHNTKSIIRVFIAITVLYWISLYIYVPTLPSYVNSKTVHLASVGLVLSMYGLWQLILRIPFGVLVDVTGRRKLLISIGLLCSAIGAVLMARGETVFVIGVGRAFTGLAAATWVPLIAVFSSFFQAEKAVFATSLLTFCASFGRMLSTLSNGFLNGLGGYPLAFYCAAAAALLSIAVLLFSKVERHTVNKFSLSAVGKLLIRQEFLLPSLLSVVIMYGTWAITYSFLPIRAHTLGADDIRLSILLALSIGALTLGNLLNAAFSRRRRHTYLLYIGILMFSFGIIMASFASSLWLLYVCAGIIGLANGVNYPTLMGLSITYVKEKERNTAMGMHQSIYAIGMFTGPWLSGIMADRIGIPLMFLITAAFVFTAGIAITYLITTHQKVLHKKKKGA